MSEHEIAIFGSGCFWCTEAVFEAMEGVLEAESGYAGGTVADPSYEEVTTGKTGHAEVVRIRFVPSRVTYADLLEVFWRSHDPTTLNRQGADVGTQYRSVIFYLDEGQKEMAERSKAEAAKLFEQPIVTQIEPLRDFYPAESYHQGYFERNPYGGYCAYVIAPKMKKLRSAGLIPER
ncbi:MAG: peptide-methionine (S)-S-oxide reductase MsrA [Puniceicoccaceae bacterium]